MQKTKTIKLILFLGDVLFTQAALFLALLARNNGSVSQFYGFSYNFAILYALWIATLFLLNLYDPYFFRKPLDFFLSLIIFSVCAACLGAAYFYFRPEFGITPKTILILNVISFDIVFIVWRYLFNRLLQVEGFREKTVMVGLPGAMENIIPQLEKNYQILAFFPPGDISGLKNIVAEQKVGSIILALDFYSHKALVREIFSALPLTINYIDIKELYESVNKKVPLEYLDEMWFLQKISKPENKWEEVAKRGIDIAVSLVGLLLFAILFPIIAVLIRLDSPGGIFYNQQRVGKNGRIFTIRKFRTMREDKNQHTEVWREKSEGSITAVGRILRRMHLDELPQSLSMLKGDVSFVGPRPEWTELAKTFETEIPFYRQRYLVKPGIIGWAQINFPASQSLAQVREKFQYDLYYIKNRSLLLDFEIMLKAIKLFFW